MKNTPNNSVCATPFLIASAVSLVALLCGLSAAWAASPRSSGMTGGGERTVIRYYVIQEDVYACLESATEAACLRARVSDAEKSESSDGRIARQVIEALIKRPSRLIFRLRAADHCGGCPAGQECKCEVDPPPCVDTPFGPKCDTFGCECKESSQGSPSLALDLYRYQGSLFSCSMGDRAMVCYSAEVIDLEKVADDIYGTAQKVIENLRKKGTP